MERPSSTSLNGRGHVVLEKEVITDADTLEKMRLAEPNVLPEQKTSPVVTPDTDPERQQKEFTPKRKRSLGIVFGNFGCRRINRGWEFWLSLVAVRYYSRNN